MLVKRPDEANQFDFDFTQQLQDTETLLAYTVTLSPQLVPVNDFISGKKVCVVLDGGINGQLYKIAVAATTNLGNALAMVSQLMVMDQAPTDDDIAELRAMTDSTDDRNTLRSLIFSYPLVDINGELPFLDELEQTVNLDWIGTYDLNAAASMLWLRKANALYDKFDYVADGGHFSRSQEFDHCLKMSRYYAARRSPSLARLVRIDSRRKEDDD